MTATSTTITPRGGRYQPHTGIWYGATHALGKVWATVLTLPKVPAGAARREALPPEYFNFPPY